MSAQEQLIRTISPYIDLSQYLSYVGVEYEFTWVELAVPSESTSYIVARTNPNKYTILNFRQLVMDQERGFYKAYTSFTEGGIVNQIPIFNLRADTSIQTGAIIERLDGATNIDPSSQTINQPLFGSAGQGNVPATGDLSQEEAVRVIPPGVEFLITFENQSENPSYFQATLKWYELSPEAVPLIRDI